MRAYLIFGLASCLWFMGCGGMPNAPAPTTPTAARLAPLPIPTDSNLTKVTTVEPSRGSATLTCDVSASSLNGRWGAGLATLPDGTVKPIAPVTISPGSWRLQTAAADQAVRLELFTLDLATANRCDLVPGAPTTRNQTGRDLYLVHGILSSGSVFNTMAAAIAKAKLYDRIWLVTYCDAQPITESATWLTTLIQRQTAKATGCDIIAHSLGGLVTRTAVEQLGLAPWVRNVVTLGTPHLGSDLAKLAAKLPLADWQDTSGLPALICYVFNTGGLAQVLADLKSGSPFLTRLNLGPTQKYTAKYDYFAIGGDVTLKGVRTMGDLVVGINNATYSGLGMQAHSLTTALVPSTHGGLTKDKAAIDMVLLMLTTQSHQPLLK